MLEIKDLAKTYGGKAALSGVSLTLPRGQIVGLFGENGAGKTTLMKCILGFVRHSGSITLDGSPVGPQNIARISFASCEHSFFPNLSPAEHAQFYRAHFPAFRQQRFDALMDFFQLPAHKALRGLSTGQKNQVEVILALCQGADYILMDEPFAGSDLFNREDFYKVLLGLLGLGLVSGAALASTEQVSFVPAPELARELKEDPELVWSSRAGAEAVKELRLDMTVQARNRLYWQISLAPGQEELAPRVDFALRSYQNQAEVRRPRAQSLELRFNDSFGASVSGGAFDVENEPNAFGLGKLLMDVASRAPADGSYTETVDLAEYYDAWPLTVDFTTQDLWMNWDIVMEVQRRLEQGDESIDPRELGAYRLMQQLQESFRFPIEGHPQLEVGLDMAAHGVVGMDVTPSPQTEEYGGVYSLSAQLGEWNYFVVDARRADGSLMDYSATPGGYGLYRLPLYTEGRVPQPEDLEFVCPLPEEESMGILTVNAEEDCLVAASRRGTDYELRLLDAEGKQRQTLVLEDVHPDQWVKLDFQPGLLLAMVYDTGEKNPRFVLYQRQEDGSYQRQLSHPLPGREEFESLIYSSGYRDRPLSILWQDGQLALAAPSGRGDYGDCGYALLVYDAEGLVFADSRQSSLSSGRKRVSSSGDCRVEPGSVRLWLADRPPEKEGPAEKPGEQQG